MKQKGKQAAFLAALLFALTSVPLPADAAGSKDGSDTEKPVKAVSSVKGDIDLSGSVLIGDAVLFSRYLAEDTAIAGDITEQGLENADMDGDGFHTGKDLSLLLKDLALIADDPDEPETTDTTAGDATGTEETTTAYNGEEIWTGFIEVWNFDDYNHDFDDVKWFYRIGEELDLSNIILYGGGSISGGGSWDIFPPGGEAPTYLTDAVESGWIEVDDSKFDNTQPGIYTIYMRVKDHPAVTGSFEVMVDTADQIWVGNSNGRWKDTYLIGEELDIMGAPLYGCGRWFEQVAAGEWYPVYWDADGDDPLASYVNDGFLDLDTSEFDNTKPGTYTIRMRYTDGSAEGEFEVRVVESLETTATCETTLECYLSETSDFIDGTYDEDWAKTIRYNFIPSGTVGYGLGCDEYCYVEPGEKVKVDLVVSNDQGTAGGRLYFALDDELTLSKRNTQGSAYDGSFQWGAADLALVWTCKEGHDQYAKNGAVIYSFTVTMPDDMSPDTILRMGLNTDRLDDICIRPQGSVQEAPDHRYSFGDLYFCPKQTSSDSEGTDDYPEETDDDPEDTTVGGMTDYTVADYGVLYISNVDMPDSYSVEEYGMPAAKTAYLVGEELDLSNLYLSGKGSFENEEWTLRGPLSDYADIIEVDATDFNNKFTGQYEILLRRTDGIPAEGRFFVDVCGGEFRIANIGLADALDKNDEYSMERFGVHAPKLMYEIGEELDLSNILISGGGHGTVPNRRNAPCGENEGEQDWKLKGVPLADLMDEFTIDASRFDNTKTGICAIDLIPKDPAYEPARFWVSVGLYDWFVNQIGLENGWGLLTIDDRNVKLRYALGEDLDIMQAPLIGFGLTEPCESLNLEPHYWAILGECTLQDLVDEDILEVDTNRYSKDSCGTYKIDLKLDELRHAWGEFDVEVYNGKAETTVSETNDTVINESCETTLCESCESRTPEKPNDTYDDWWIDFSGFKTEYRIGEELDLEGLLDSGIYGAGMYYEWGEGEWIPVYWDAFGEETIRSGIEDGSMELDISEFDNTKPGTYMIHCSGRNVSESVEVTVIGDVTCGGTGTTCSYSESMPECTATTDTTWICACEEEGWPITTEPPVETYDDIILRILNVGNNERSLEKYGIPAMKNAYRNGEELDFSNLLIDGWINHYEGGEYKYSVDLFDEGRIVFFSDVQDEFIVDTSQFYLDHTEFLSTARISLLHKKTNLKREFDVFFINCETGTGRLWLGDDPDDSDYIYNRSLLNGSPAEDRSWMIGIMLMGAGYDNEGNAWVIGDLLDEAVEAGWLEVEITETEDPDVYNVTMKRTDGIPAQGSFTLILID